MKNNTITLTNEKLKGQFYTPEFIINNILDLAGYYGESIIRKHVIDNSCGDGAFLVLIVTRYCDEFLKFNSDLNTLSEELLNYIQDRKSTRLNSSH